MTGPGSRTHGQGMGKICWKLASSIGLIVFSQTASAALEGRALTVVHNSTYRNSPHFDDPINDARLIRDSSRNFTFVVNDKRTAFDLDETSIGRLAQVGQSAAPAATPPQDSKGPPDQSSPAISSQPGSTSATEVVRAAPTVPGCALKYLAAELAGELKGRKWKEFRQEECGASTTMVVFPLAVAPKYSGEKPDKARTLTCADQFNANKATKGNGGMKWIEKSGGYYSECVVRLKG
jgi:hypothetical protein